MKNFQSQRFIDTTFPEYSFLDHKGNFYSICTDVEIHKLSKSGEPQNKEKLLDNLLYFKKTLFSTV